MVKIDVNLVKVIILKQFTIYITYTRGCQMKVYVYKKDCKTATEQRY